MESNMEVPVLKEEGRLVIKTVRGYDETEESVPVQFVSISLLGDQDRPGACRISLGLSGKATTKLGEYLASSVELGTLYSLIIRYGDLALCVAAVYAGIRYEVNMCVPCPPLEKMTIWNLFDGTIYLLPNDRE